jgi:hypothetical protein
MNMASAPSIPMRQLCGSAISAKNMWRMKMASEYPWKRMNDKFSSLCNAETYQRTCPFCKREHEQRMYINIICQCGGKYYFAQGFWLDRKTGERKTDSDEKML